ncbi:MAG: alpha/beta hydrolase [Sandaracinaceae bacterium]
MLRTGFAPAFVLLAVAASGCGLGPVQRRMTYGHQVSQANHGVEMDYAVLTPRGWVRGEELPLVVFLHGGGDSHDAFDRHGVSERLLDGMASGRIPRAVVVLPNGHLGFWANWWAGTRRYEDWVVEELIPRVRARYQTLPCPEHCHVMGVSMGGAGSLRFALNRPDTFSTVASLSGPIFTTEEMLSFVQNRLLAILIPSEAIFGPPDRRRVMQEDLFLVWTSAEATRLDRIFLAWGDHDRGGIIEASRRFHEHLERHDIPHTAVEYEGNHSWASWSPVIEQAFVEQVERVE